MKKMFNIDNMTIDDCDEVMLERITKKYGHGPKTKIFMIDMGDFKGLELFKNRSKLWWVRAYRKEILPEVFEVLGISKDTKTTWYCWTERRRIPYFVVEGHYSKDVSLYFGGNYGKKVLQLT